MKLYRLGIMCLAAAAVGLLASSAASAAIPTFKPAADQRITFKSGDRIFQSATGERILCTSDHGIGLVINGGDLRIKRFWLGCVGTKGTTTCKVMSAGASGSEEIVENTLKGELGEVAASEATSKAGLYLVPESGKVFTTPLGSCITTAPIEGSLAGEVTLTGTSSTTNQIVFLGSGGKQSIKGITTKAGRQSPSLSGFGLVGVSEETTEELEFSEAIEVT